jgi:hypothetical protein
MGRREAEVFQDGRYIGLSKGQDRNEGRGTDDP